MRKKTLLIVLVCLLLLPSLAGAKQLSMLIIDADSYIVNMAVRDLTLPDDITVNFFTYRDLTDNPEARAFVDRSQVLVVDVMMRELSEYVIENVDLKKKARFCHSQIQRRRRPQGKGIHIRYRAL